MRACWDPSSIFRSIKVVKYIIHIKVSITFIAFKAMKNVAWRTFIFIWQKKSSLCVLVFLYYKVKSVVRAKQTVINFLKTCINIYIVLPGPVLLNENRTQRSRDRLACRYVWRFHLERQWPFSSQFFTGIIWNTMVDIVHLAGPQHVH